MAGVAEYGLLVGNTGGMLPKVEGKGSRAARKDTKTVVDGAGSCCYISVVLSRHPDRIDSLSACACTCSHRRSMNV